MELGGAIKFCDFDASFQLLRMVDQTWAARSTQNLGGGVQARFAIVMPLLMVLLLSAPCINETEHCAIAKHIERGHTQVS
jgi:hypothetical protein